MRELLNCICTLAARVPVATAGQMVDALRQITDPSHREAGVRGVMQLLHVATLWFTLAGDVLFYLFLYIHARLPIGVWQ